MNGHCVEVSHRRANDDMRLEVAATKPLNDLAHQRHETVGVRGLVRNPALGRGHEDRRLSPSPRGLVTLEPAGIEVEIEDHAVPPLERGVACHDGNVIHCPCVVREGELARIGHIRTLWLADDCDGVAFRHGKPLD